MTLQEIVEEHGFGRMARRTEGQNEAIKVIKEHSETTYEVEGMQTNAIYTELKDADGYEYIPSIGQLKARSTGLVK